jgi:5-methyltetrahydropteroyltriglutamate--homocysteine methyltransferase
VLVGCIDVASNIVETPEEVAATISRSACACAGRTSLSLRTNCGMALMAAPIACAKLEALMAGPEMTRKSA